MAYTRVFDVFLFVAVVTPFLSIRGNKQRSDDVITNFENCFLSIEVKWRSDKSATKYIIYFAIEFVG